MPPAPERNRRADARRSRAAILAAATGVLNSEPDAGMETIATAAGVTRQTIYAHFPSREQLLLAVIEELTAEVVTAMDAADPDAGPAADALLRLLDVGDQVTRRYPVLMEKISAVPVSPQTDRDQHAPIADRIRRVIQRGQQTGEFDNQLPVDWLVTATIRLAHVASEEQNAGRLSSAAGKDALCTTLLRLLDAAPKGGHSPRSG